MVLHPILFYHYCKNTKITTLAEKKRKGQDSTKLNMMFLILAYSLKYLFMCMTVTTVLILTVDILNWSA